MLFFLLLLLFLVSYIFLSGYAKSKIFKIITNLISPTTEVSINKLYFSLKDGIVAKGISLQDSGHTSFIRKIGIRRTNNTIYFKIYDADLDLDLFYRFLTKAKDKNSISYPLLEISLQDTQFKRGDENLFRIEDGFMCLAQVGLNWDLNMDFKFTNLELKGYSCLGKETYFTLDCPALSLTLAGNYNFNTEELKSKFYFRGKSYDFKTCLSYQDKNFILKETLIGKFLLPGPINLELDKEISSPWSIQTQDFKARGNLSFQIAKDKINFYFKVLNAHFGDYKLVTNFYLDYSQREREIKFYSSGTVLNNMPLPEIESQINFLKDGIVIEKIKYQGGITVSGYLDYKSNFSLNGSFDKFSAQELLDVIFPLYARDLYLNGIDGELTCISNSGIELVELVLKLSNGKISDIVFESAKLHLLGNFKVLEFINSQLSVNNKPMLLEGKLAVSKFPKPETWKEVYLTPLIPSLPWAEIYLKERRGERSYSLATKLKENIKLDYNVEILDEENYDKNEFSLEIKGKPNFKLRLRKDEEIMGLEKTIEF